MVDDDKIHIHIDAAERAAHLPEYQQDLPCPTCGTPPETGFGLAGGGFGIYSYCSKCGIILTKSETSD